MKQLSFFCDRDDHVYAIVEALCYAIPDTTERYYEGFYDVSRTHKIESAVVQNSLLERCKRVSEQVARQCDVALSWHLNECILAGRFETGIMARDVSRGMSLRVWGEVRQVDEAMRGLISLEGKWIDPTEDDCLIHVIPIHQGKD